VQMSGVVEDCSTGWRRKLEKAIINFDNTCCDMVLSSKADKHLILFTARSQHGKVMNIMNIMNEQAGRRRDMHAH